MKKILGLFVGIIFILSLFVACGSEEPVVAPHATLVEDGVDGDEVDGDEVDGDEVDGDGVDGDEVDGDEVDGYYGVDGDGVTYYAEPVRDDEAARFMLEHAQNHVFEKITEVANGRPRRTFYTFEEIRTSWISLFPGNPIGIDSITDELIYEAFERVPGPLYIGRADEAPVTVWVGEDYERFPIGLQAPMVMLINQRIEN